MKLISIGGMLLSGAYFVLRFMISSAISDAQTGTVLYAINKTITAFTTALPYSKDIFASYLSALDLGFGIVGGLSIAFFVISLATNAGINESP